MSLNGHRHTQIPHTQTRQLTTVTLAAHARRGLTILCLVRFVCMSVTVTPRRSGFKRPSCHYSCYLTGSWKGLWMMLSPWTHAMPGNMQCLEQLLELHRSWSMECWSQLLPLSLSLSGLPSSPPFLTPLLPPALTHTHTHTHMYVKKYISWFDIIVNTKLLCWVCRNIFHGQ